MSEVIFPDHFTYEEMIVTQHRDIKNVPPKSLLPVLAGTANRMETIRNAILGGNPVTVVSGYRCEDLEQRVCWIAYKDWCKQMKQPNTPGSWEKYFQNKAHPKGYGCDFICPKFGPPAKIVAAIRANGTVEFDQLIEESTWVHISFDPRMRQMVFKL